MWLRHALRLLLIVIAFSACSSPDRQAVDKLNSLSYACHYRSLDSTEHYAAKAMALTSSYKDGEAEALNNLAFVRLAQMRYAEARQLLEQVHAVTDNQLELLVADVQLMRLCQRCSHNREFYNYRERAYRAVGRINEDRDALSERQRRRLLYAESELSIVESTYFYYVGQERQSVNALQTVPADIQKDTAQWLNYLYNIGAGGIISASTQEEVDQAEFDYLMRCYQLSLQHGYSYFAANSLEAIAEHMAVTASRERLVADNAPAMAYLFPDEESVPVDEVPILLAMRSLELFQAFGDVYQIAGAYRTLATCHRAMGDYEASIAYLEQSLADSTIFQAPDLIASIREQFSVSYAAINDKPMSDQNRNLYLDLQEQTRQDRSLEARADQLNMTVAQLNKLLTALFVAIILLLFSLWLFNYLHRRGSKQGELNQLLAPLNDWQQRHLHDLELQEEREDEVREQLALHRMHVETGRRLHLEQRAKVALVNSITPFIDRMLHEARLLPKLYGKQRRDSMDYIRELAEKVNEQNDVLTDWIQLRRGELSLHIESFALQPLFDFVSKSKGSFSMKGIELNVVNTEAKVKADRILTLFMINTLADNARKYTDSGGKVSISTASTADYVEISVSDTGRGMSAEELDHVVHSRYEVRGQKSEESHGFGLLNCKGIIDKYRKVSQIFSVCILSAESSEGNGSRFFFRLPHGAARLLLPLVLMFSAFCAKASADLRADLPAQAKVYADSAYFSNINGNFFSTLAYVDSCRQCLNKYYRQITVSGCDTLHLIGDPSVMASDIRWYHDSLNVNFDIILDMRNEAAVAALALHEWELYTYNNRIYTQLFKEMSADSQLDSYCRAMQQSQTNKSIALALLVLVLIAILPAYYFLYYRHRLYDKFCLERVKAINKVLLSDATDEEKLNSIAYMAKDQFPVQLQSVVSKVLHALQLSVNDRRRHREDIEEAVEQLHCVEQEEASLHVSNSVLENCLSTLKHETMYFPSRICQLVDREEASSLPEVIEYYRELFGVLSLQAMRQVEGVKLHLEPLEHELLADRTLTGYLLDILRKQSGGHRLDVDYRPYDEHFVELHVSMPSLHLSETEADKLFEPSVGHIPFLLCRQIVREHGEAIHRSDFGIKAETVVDGQRDQTIIILKLPRQICKSSK